MDNLTGSHEPTVVIPWWLDCRIQYQLDPWKCARVKVEMRRKIANTQADMRAADYNRMRIDELTRSKR